MAPPANAAAGLWAQAMNALMNSGLARPASHNAGTAARRSIEPASSPVAVAAATVDSADRATTAPYPPSP